MCRISGAATEGRSGVCWVPMATCLESFKPTEPFIRLHGNLGSPVTLVPTVETHASLRRYCCHELTVVVHANVKHSGKWLNST